MGLVFDLETRIETRCSGDIDWFFVVITRGRITI